MTGDPSTDGGPTTSAAERWDAARDEVAPAIGERMTALVAHALLVGAGSADRAGELDAELRAQGDDPDAPAVTEVEGLMLAWAREAGAGSTGDAAARLDGLLSDATRARLDELAAAARALTA